MNATAPAGLAVAALAAAAAWLLESARLRRVFDGAVRRGGA